MSDLDQLSTVKTTETGPMTDESFEKMTRSHALAAGEEVFLNKIDYTAKKLMLGVGWDFPGVDPSGIDVDFSCFLLDKNDQTREDSDFVFYNQPEGVEGAVVHGGDNRTGIGDGDDETILIDLEALPYDIVKIVFCISIHEADLRDQHIGLMRDGFIRVVNAANDRELIRYPITQEFTNKLVYALGVAELTREGPEWRFAALSEEIEGGLAKIATRYGLMVTG